MKWKRGKQWVEHLGPKVEECQVADCHQGAAPGTPLEECVLIHTAHWRAEDVVSWCLARRISGANSEALVSLNKEFACNRIQKNPSLSLVLRSWWTFPFPSSSWRVSLVMHLSFIKTFWQAHLEFLNVLCWLVFAFAEGTSCSGAQYLN